MAVTLVNQPLDDKCIMTKEMQSDNTELKAEAIKKIAANNANLSTLAQQLRTVMQTLTNR